MDRYLPITINKTYFACSSGKIYNKHGKELFGCKNKGGYSIVKIKDRETNKFKCYYIHRLIWETFNGKIPDGMEIDHINTIKNDNRLENLQLVTPKENMNNPMTIELLKQTNKNKGFCKKGFHKR